MIDPTAETLISLTNAAKLKMLPARRAGKRPHASCFYRWAKHGCRGVILETIQVGGTRCTSIEALARFFHALTFSADESPTVRSPSKRQRAADAAMETLRSEGV